MRDNSSDAHREGESIAAKRSPLQCLVFEIFKKTQKFKKPEKKSKLVTSDQTVMVKYEFLVTY